MIAVRLARPSDRAPLAVLRHALWPAAPVEEHERTVDAIFAGEWSTIFPYVIFVAEAPDGAMAAFAEVTIRSRADGCDPTWPVGYLEGWNVAEAYRRRGIGAALLRAAEDWAREHGCIEMASDTWIDHEVAQRAHEALGFTVVDRCVHYKKRL